MKNTKWKGANIIIVLHDGGAKGWVDGADLVFRSKTNSADYHDEMNSEPFMECLMEQILPRLEEPSAIILDNAHPTTNRKTNHQHQVTERTTSDSRHG